MKKYWVIIFLLLTISCQNNKTLSYRANIYGSTYEFEYPADWVVDYDSTLLKKDKNDAYILLGVKPPKSDYQELYPGINKLMGYKNGNQPISIYFEPLDCPTKGRENTNPDNTEICEDGPESEPFFKKKTVKVSDKYIDGWHNEKCGPIIDILLSPKKGVCALFKVYTFSTEKIIYEMAASLREVKK